MDLQEIVGSQDQVACALGGLNFIEFGGRENWNANPITLSPMLQSEIDDRMVLVYSGVHRSSSHISKTLLDGIATKKRAMNRTIQLAQECRTLIESASNLDLVGEMLEESWELKRELNPMSVTPELQELSKRAQLAGALGGKILGAGGGGFCMFWVRRGAKEEFLSRLGSAIHVPAKISLEGSTSILNV